MAGQLEAHLQLISSPTSIYPKLEKQPQNMTIAFMEKGGQNNQQSPKEYLKYLHNCYGDPNAQRRAVDRLRAMKQKDTENNPPQYPRH